MVGVTQFCEPLHTALGLVFCNSLITVGVKYISWKGRDVLSIPIPSFGAACLTPFVTIASVITGYVLMKKFFDEEHIAFLGMVTMNVLMMRFLAPQLGQMCGCQIHRVEILFFNTINILLLPFFPSSKYTKFMFQSFIYSDI